MGQYKHMTKSHGVKWSAKFRYLNPETGEMDIEYRRGFDTKREAKQYSNRGQFVHKVIRYKRPKRTGLFVFTSGYHPLEFIFGGSG